MCYIFKNISNSAISEFKEINIDYYCLIKHIIWDLYMYSYRKYIYEF